jgi:hypothetical protein
VRTVHREIGSASEREKSTRCLEHSASQNLRSHPANPPIPQAIKMAELYPDLKDRPIKNTVCLFDVDGTLTPARLRVSAEMLKTLSAVRHKCAIGFVSLTLVSGRLRFCAGCRRHDPLQPALPSLQPSLTPTTGRWLRPRQTRRAARHRFPPCHNHVRLLLFRKRPHLLPPW